MKPMYDGKGKLMDLHILVNENYNKTSNTSLSFGDPWIETKIRENSDEVSDEKLIKILEKNEIIYDTDFIRRKGSTFIYKSDPFLIYSTEKSLYSELLSKFQVNDSINKSANQKTKDIDF